MFIRPGAGPSVKSQVHQGEVAPLGIHGSSYLACRRGRGGIFRHINRK